MNKKCRWLAASLAAMFVVMGAMAQTKKEIIHDVEFDRLQRQFGEKWAAEDKDIDKMLAEIAAGRFKGVRDIVFMHTGGIFGLFPQRGGFTG